MKIIFIRRVTVSFPQLRIKPFHIPKFRGYLSRKYPNFALIHNHLEDGKLRYAYPLIQFKVIDYSPTIVGIGKGIDILKQVFLDISELDINSQLYELNEKAVIMDKVELGRCNQSISYRFLLPWMGLNQEKHNVYLIWNQKRSYLEKDIEFLASQNVIPGKKSPW